MRLGLRVSNGGPRSPRTPRAAATSSSVTRSTPCWPRRRGNVGRQEQPERGLPDGSHGGRTTASRRAGRPGTRHRRVHYPPSTDRGSRERSMDRSGGTCSMEPPGARSAVARRLSRHHRGHRPWSSVGRDHDRHRVLRHGSPPSTHRSKTPRIAVNASVDEMTDPEYPTLVTDVLDRWVSNLTDSPSRFPNDRSFVAGVVDDGQRRSVVAALAGLA